MAETPEELKAGLMQFLSRENPVLFAGAGVSGRVGLPTWGEYLERLAATCEPYDELSAKLIRQKITDGDFGGAAQIYLSVNRMPKGELMKGLSAPLEVVPSADELLKLEPLIGLGFSAIVTPNFDSVAHNVYAAVARRDAPNVELDDQTLKGATHRSHFFIARIHGRADIAESMRLTDAQFEGLKNHPYYLDFLISLLRSRSCLFVGFSFADPALQHILGVYEELLGPQFPTLHSALIPDGQTVLAARLRQLNIQPLVYDPADGHRAAWQAIRDVFDERRRATGLQAVASAIATVPSANGATAHRLMAFAYAQMRTAGARKPITKQVQDALIRSTLGQPGDAPKPVNDVLESIRRTLAVSALEAKEVFDSAMESLVQSGDVARTGDGRIYSLRTFTNALDEHIKVLAQSVITRMKVREKVLTEKSDLDGAGEILQTIFAARAWDLAAHFAGAATTGWSVDLAKVIQSVVNKHIRAFKLNAPGAMERAILDLLRAPEDEEAALLAELGRAAFGTQLVLSTPRQALFQKYALPQRLYLDANILMPAIVPGHPLRPVYTGVVERLVVAARQVDTTVHLVAGRPFLNEIISHRKKAIELVEQEKLDDPNRIARHLGFYGATRINVFVSAYASFVGRSKREIRFAEFLKENAPYENEADLEKYLAEQGIEVDAMDFREADHPVFRQTYMNLLEGYERGPREKETVLIRHEAQQLTRLRVDASEGVRSVFVTGDQQLRRALQLDDRLHDCLGSIVSHLGLIALVDVMVGFAPDTRAMARLMWDVGSDDEQKAVVEYFISLALREYDDAMAMEMQDVAQSLANQAVKDAKAINLDLLSATSSDIARTAELLDRYENKFFERKAEAIAARRAAAQAAVAPTGALERPRSSDERQGR